MDEPYEDDFEESTGISSRQQSVLVNRAQEIQKIDESSPMQADPIHLMRGESKNITGQSPLESSAYEEDFYSATPSAFGTGAGSAVYEDDFVEPPTMSAESIDGLIHVDRMEGGASTGVPNTSLASQIVSGLIFQANVSASAKLSPQRMVAPELVRSYTPEPVVPGSLLESPGQSAREPSVAVPLRSSYESYGDDFEPDTAFVTEQEPEQTGVETTFDANDREYSDVVEADDGNDIDMTAVPDLRTFSNMSGGSAAISAETPPVQLSVIGKTNSGVARSTVASMLVRQTSELAIATASALRSPLSTKDAPILVEAAKSDMESTVSNAQATAEAVGPSDAVVEDDVLQTPVLAAFDEANNLDLADAHQQDEGQGVVEETAGKEEEEVVEAEVVETEVVKTEVVKAEVVETVVVETEVVETEVVETEVAEAEVVEAEVAETSSPREPPALPTQPVAIDPSVPAQSTLATSIMGAVLTAATDSAVRALSPPRPLRPEPASTASADSRPTQETQETHAAQTPRPSSPKSQSSKSDAHCDHVGLQPVSVTGFVHNALQAATQRALASPLRASRDKPEGSTSEPVVEQGQQHDHSVSAQNDDIDEQAPPEQPAAAEAEPAAEQNTSESEGPMVWDEDLNRLVPYAEYCKTHSIPTRPGNAESKRAAQLRGAVSESRSSTKRMSKKAQDEADRTFITSILYRPPVKNSNKTNESPYRRPVTAGQTRSGAPVTKRDLLRVRSAGQGRESKSSPSPSRRSSPGKKSPARKSSPSPPRKQSTLDKRTLFVPPQQLLPSKTLPKELVNYLFDSNRESELKISLFCQHGRHFSACNAELCMDAHEKYRWLNLVHIKAKEACELVCDADKLWRNKLETSLAEEIEERKLELDQKLEELNTKLKRRSLDRTRLLKKGVAFYESALPAMHRGDITAEELYKSTGWTAEHYENFKRRLKLEQDRAEVQRKMFLDQQAHKNLEEINQLKGSLSAPMMYLDGMLKERLDAIRTAVKRIDTCFQYSIKMAAGIGTGKSEEQLKAEAAARSPMKNVIIAERLLRNTKHGFEILKASLAIIADVCSDVRLMYRGITRDHDLKKEKKGTRNSEKSRSPSPERPSRPISPVGRISRSPAKQRPVSAPSTSPTKKAVKKKRPVQSATVRSSSEAILGVAASVESGKLQQGSRVSYAEDFESDGGGAHAKNRVDAGGSLEIRDDTYEEEINEMMHDLGVDDWGSHRASVSSGVRGGGSGSIVEDVAEEIKSAGNSSRLEARPQSSKGSRNAGRVEAERSVGLSVGSGIEDELVAPGQSMSEKGTVLQKARDLAISRTASDNHYSAADEVASDDDDGVEDQNSDGEEGGAGMYEDDFDGDDALVKAAFGPQKKIKRKGSTKKKRNARSKKVAGLIAADALCVPLAKMKPTQRNHQTVLHGLLLANNIPIHVEDDEGQVRKARLKPIVLTDPANRPIPVQLVPKKEKPPPTPLVIPHAVLERRASTPLAPTKEKDFTRCYLCKKVVPINATKHLPMQTVSNDEAVFERAKEHMRKSGQIFPKYEAMHVTTNAEVQREWVTQQLELQNNLLRAGRRGSVALQKHDHPFCSWECVKGWAITNCTLQMKYHTEIMIDVAAGYTVLPTVVEVPSL